MGAPAPGVPVLPTPLLNLIFSTIGYIMAPPPKPLKVTTTLISTSLFCNSLLLVLYSSHSKKENIEVVK